jgi:hypothetical protein
MWHYSSFCAAVCFLLSMSFSFPFSLPPKSVFLYLYSLSLPTLSPSHFLFLSLSVSVSLSLSLSLSLYSTHSLATLPPHPCILSVSVLAVKTKTIPVWDEALAARVRDGMTLQGTFVHITKSSTYTPFTVSHGLFDVSSK